MPAPFASAKRRPARAREHVDNLKATAETFFKTKPYARMVEPDAQGFEEHKIKLTADLPAVLTDLTYEAVEALRASLDHVASAVAVLCGAPRPELVHFPVADSTAELENVIKGRMKGIPPNIVALFGGFKPYKGGNDLIWALNRIRGQSAHRLIVPIGTVGGSFHLRSVTMSSPLPMEIPPSFIRDNVKNEIIFAKTGRNANFDYDVQFSVYIAFGQVDALAGQPVLDTLDRALGEIESIIAAMEAECRRIGLMV